MQHVVAASARQGLSNERSRAFEAKVETRSPGMDDSSADSSSVSAGGGRERALREQHAKWQVAVASAEWGLVRARVAWEELSKVHKRARELLGAALELHGRERGEEGTSEAHGRRIASERTGERRWGEIERFLALALPSMPEALQQGWLVGVEGSGEANVSFHGAPMGSSSDGAVGDAGRRGLKVSGWGAAGGDMDVGLDMKMLRLHVERLEAENEGLHAALLALERQMADNDAELDELEDELQELDEAREGRSTDVQNFAEAAGARSADPGGDKDEDKGGWKAFRNGRGGGAAGDVDAALRVEEMGADNGDHCLTAEGRLELEKELEDRREELDRERKLRAALEQVNLFADAPKHLACLYSTATSALLDKGTGRGQRPPAHLPNRSLAHTRTTTCPCTANCHASRLP